MGLRTEGRARHGGEIVSTIGPLNGCISFGFFVSIIGCFGAGAFITIHYDSRLARAVGLILTLAVVPVWFLGRVLCEMGR